MKETQMMAISIVAVVLSVVAITSAVILRPTTSTGAGTSELADNSVTGAKITDGTIKDADITPEGISKIANSSIGSNQIIDNSITLQDLSSIVVAVISGLENIADNSITSAKIADGTITSDDIGSGAVTSSDIADGTITTGDLATAVSNRLGKAATKIVAADGSGDYTDIQSAINALPASGGVVYIREGTYTVSSSIAIISSNVTLVGAGAATKIFLANGANVDVISATWGQNIVIANLCIDGNKANQTAASSGIKFTNVENSRISGCRIEKSKDCGVYLDSSSRNVITNSTVESGGNLGIYLSSSNNNTVMGNTIESNSDDGIHLYSGSNNNTVMGNTIESNSSDGIFCSGSNNNTVMGNTIESNSGIGIYLYSGSNNNTVMGNTIKSNSSDGIFCNGANNNTITGNTSESNGGSGIQLYSSSNNSVTGNTIKSNGSYGIMIASSNNNVVVGNVVMNNSKSVAGAYDGIYISTSDYNVITSNRCTDDQLVKTQGYGINIFNGTCDFNLVDGNVLVGNLIGSRNDASGGDTTWGTNII